MNLIEIDFYGVEHVLKAWLLDMDHLNSVTGYLETAANLAFEDRRTDLLAKLLKHISTELGYEMSEIDLKRGGYAPSGWAWKDQQETALKHAAITLFHGTPLRVFPWNVDYLPANPQNPPTPRPDILDLNS